MHTRQLFLRTGLVLAAIACDGDAPCFLPPCAFIADLTVAVTGPSGQAPVAGAYAIATGAAFRDSLACSSGCFFSHGAGTYAIDVGAPGFATVHRSATIVAKPATKCPGCGNTIEQQIEIALVPAP